jgi:hypothetical protein
MASIKLLIALLVMVPASAFSQKNVTEVSKSGLTGIILPAGAKQDKRILSTVSAKSLLDMKAKEIGRECSGPAEVIYLPLKSGEKQSEEIKKSFTLEGYKISEVKGDLKYSLIFRGEKSWLIYLDDAKSETDLYISELLAIPGSDKEQTNTTIASADKTKSEITQPVAAISTSATTQIVSNNKNVVTADPVITTSTGGYKYKTTNFNDGWTATETADYVKVSKDRIVARVYYPVTMTEQMRPPVTEPHYYFWDLLVLPSFTIINKWEWKESLSYFQNYYIYAEAVDKSTGSNCYIGLDISLSSGTATPVLVIAPDKQTYDGQFSHPDNFKKMPGYNKFPVALTDLTGTWLGSDGATANYYNSVTGSYSGMGFVSMSDQFTFSANGDYTSKHSGASGMVGTMNTYNQEYKGKATVSDWEIILPNRWQGKTDTFDAWFEAVKGGRVLRLVDKQYSGMKYALVKKIK